MGSRLRPYVPGLGGVVSGSCLHCAAAPPSPLAVVDIRSLAPPSMEALAACVSVYTWKFPQLLPTRILESSMELLLPFSLSSPFLSLGGHNGMVDEMNPRHASPCGCWRMEG